MESKNIFEISSPKQWKTIPKSKLTESGYPVYGANGKIGFYSDYNHEEPTVLITCRGATCGEINISEPYSYITGNAMCLDDLSDDVDLKYLFYFLKGRNMSDVISGTAQPQITKTNLEKLKIPLPSLSEQKTIVAKLDRAQRLIDIDKDMLGKYDELIQSVFLEMFGDPVTNPKDWEVKLLKNACSKVTDGTHDTPERLEYGVPLITGKNIRSFKIDFDNTDFVSHEDHEKIYKRCNPEFGDVLYVNIGAGIGTAAFNNIHEEFSMKNVALLKPKSGILSGRYLESCLNNEVMKEKIKYIASLGGAQKFLGLGDIRKLKIPVPDIDLQTKFGSYYAKIENEKTKTLESIKKSEALFSSLVQGAFG